MAHIRRPGGASYPTSYIGTGLEADYTADSLIQADGTPVALLRNNTGSGVDLAPGGGGTAPTFRIDDDFLPYISFDGVANNLQNLAYAPAGAGVVPKTIYNVLRVDVAIGAANAKAICLTRNGVVAGVADGTWTLRPDAGKRHMCHARGLPAASVIQAGVAEPNDAFSINGGIWLLTCLRWGNRGNPAKWWGSYFQNSPGGWGVAYNPGVFSAWNYDRLGVGANPDIAPFVNDFCRMDFRALSIFGACHTDEQVKSNMRFLAHKWKVCVLD